MESGENERKLVNLDAITAKSIGQLSQPAVLKATIPEYLRALEMLREMEPPKAVVNEIIWIDELDKAA